MTAALHTNHEERYHLGISLGSLIELFLEGPFLSCEDIQAMVADLRKSNPLDGPAARREGIFGLFPFPRDAG